MMKRRTALAAIGAAPFAPALSRTGLSQTRSIEVNPDDPDDRLMIFRKLAHTMDDSIAYFWADLRRLGMVGTTMTRMWDIKIAAMVIARDIGDDGSYETTTISMVSYRDPETGEILETYDNPWTGKTVDITLYPSAPSKRTITKDGILGAPRPREGTKTTWISPIGPAHINGDDVWVYGDDIIRVESTGPREELLFEANDWSTFRGSLKHVADPENLNPPSDWYFNDVLSWSPWLEMAGQEGSLISRGFGRKVFSFEDMPPEIITFVKEFHPEVYKDPVGSLNGG